MLDKLPRRNWLQEQIERHRLRLGLSMRELSLKAGLNETAVKAIMQGRSESPRGKTLQAIARALGTSVSELIGHGAESDRSALPFHYANSNRAVSEENGGLDVLREREQELETQLRVLEGRLQETRELLAKLSSRRSNARSESPSTKEAGTQPDRKGKPAAEDLSDDNTD